MAVMTINRNYNIGGVAHAENRNVACGRVVSFEKSVPLAKQGTLTLRTDNNTGTITMASGSHGITTGARVAIFWLDATTGAVTCQRRVTVGTVSGTSLPIDLGTGSNLPPLSTVVQVAVTQEVDITVTAADIVAFAVSSQKPGLIEICQSDGTEIAAHVLETANSVWSWDQNLGDATPLSNTIAKVFVSHNEINASGNLTTFTMKGGFGAV